MSHSTDRRKYGCQDMVGRLRRVVVRTPGTVFGEADPAAWHYTGKPDLDAARDEHSAFVALLRECGAEVIDFASEPTRSADAIYTHDPCIVADAGAVLLRMGKQLRGDEPEETGRALETIGVPILARLGGTALSEGGDLLWVDHETLAAGQGFRTNAEGIRQLDAALGPLGVTVVPVPLPYDQGPAACLHLMSVISMLDHDLAVVHRPLLPVPFLQLLADRGVETVDAAPEEFATMAPNVLALAPRDCVMLEGNPVTLARIEAAGCRVRTYRGDEISLKCEGGPTCLTRPVLRD